MKKRAHIILLLITALSILLFFGIFINNNDLAVLNPSGIIGIKQRNLLIFATLLSSVVIIPVFIMTAVFAWRYRASNKSAKYKPEWSDNNWLEVIWWGIPIIIIIILGTVTWRTTHELDPYRPLESNVAPVKIQVVAMQWKWLFIYPEENIATVNYIRIPTNTPINFEITADAPMNSFWIPKLGGQIYAMNGMVTKLHLQADHDGIYEGVSANISGEGFASMKFKVDAGKEKDYREWLNKVKDGKISLDNNEYKKLEAPSIKHPVATYASAEANLFADIIDKYMAHGDKPKPESSMEYYLQQHDNKTQEQ